MHLRFSCILSLITMALCLGCASPSSVPLTPVENPPAATPAGAYDISQVTTPPRVTSQARPRYPVALRQQGIAGEGVIAFVVGTDGLVHNAVVVRATDIRFGEAARESVMQWRFRPAELRGEPVACHMMVPIMFSVDQR